MNEIFPDVPSLQPIPKVKTEDITYASLLSSTDPISAYKQAKEEVVRTGESSLVNSETKKYTEEQQIQNKQDVETILANPTISPEVRRQVAKNYITGSIGLQDLRDKYLIKQAAVDTATTELDREAQDIYSQSVAQRDRSKQEEATLDSAHDSAITIKNIIKGVASVGADMAMMIPAGFAGMFSVIKDKDPILAEKTVKDIQAYAYNPTELGAQKVKESIGKVMEFIDIPFKYLGDKTLEITGSPAAATIVYAGSQLVGYGGAYKASKAAIKLGKPSVPKVSPLDTAETASKEAASTIAAAALKDSTDTAVEALQTSKAAIINDLVLPKLEDEFGEIKPDARVKIEEQDTILEDIYKQTEFNPDILPVTQITKDRDLYVKVLTETANSHLLLSSSVLGTTEKAFGRSGKNYEALIDTAGNTIEGKAVFGRNQYHGYKTEKGAKTYLEKIKEQTAHLPEKGNLSIIEKDGEYFITWDFKKQYDAFDHLVFGADTLSAHVMHPRFDVSWFANSPVGDKIWPSYMRMKEWIPSIGATTSLKEANIEGKFIEAQRTLFMSSKKPKDLVAMLRRGEQEGKIYKLNDFQTINQHLTKAENEQLHAEYVGYRRIQNHLYRFSDRAYRYKLNKEGIKNLYDKEGNHIGLTSEPIPLEQLTDVSKVWDIEKKIMVEKSELSSGARIVRLKEPIRNGDHLLRYGLLSPWHQFGELRAGTLTKIPGYVARHYKEWFVLDKIPKVLYVDGYKVPESELRNYKQAIAMGGTRSEINQLLERYQKEDINNNYSTRAEEKRIEDSIIHDSQIYDSYLKESHKRGKGLPSLNREANIEDPLVAQTKAIMGVSKITAWDQVRETMQKQYLKAYGDFTGGKFPQAINEIIPKRHMDALEEKRFLAAQKVYQQWEIQQISQLPSDVLWKNTLNKIADVFEKMDISSPILREWGEKGIVPVRAAKALGSNLFLFARPIRMWFVQPQQWKELSLVSPSFFKSLQDIMPITSGLLSRSHILRPYRNQVDVLGRKVVKDYDEVIQALDDSGLLQAVNKNQMVHGIWRDSLHELDPKSQGVVLDTIKNTKEIAGSIISTPLKLSRKIGYDPAELTNQVTLWLFAKHRWEEQNPGKNWNTPENKATIMQLQTRLGHMASTRAGMYSWQDGMISVITQFAAIPFKSTMQMISAKEFTTSEKAKLAAARLFWYGKYGIPGGAAIYTILERGIEDEKDKEKIEPWTNGATDAISNAVLSGMFDASHEKTDVAASKSLSTVVDSIWFYDLGETLYKMSQGEPTEQKFPFITAGSSLFTATKEMYDLFTLPQYTGQEVDAGKIMWKAVSFAGGLSDYSKSQLSEQLSKSGSSLGYQQSSGEAIARLAGIAPKGELMFWEAKRDETKREKYIKEDAKKIHQRLIAYIKNNSNDPSEKEQQDIYISGMQSFLAGVDEGYKDELLLAILKEDRNSHRTLKESIMKYFYEHARNKNDAQLMDMENHLSKVNDPDIQSLLRDIRNWRNKE